jgi:hypothetical protein
MARALGELCEAAKRGRLCIDDLCHSGGMTLCGFALDDYRDICDEWEPDYGEDFEETKES